MSLTQITDDAVATAKAQVPAEQAQADKLLPDAAAEFDALETGQVGAAVADFNGFKKEVKAGYKTTEFWLTLATVVLTRASVFHFPGKYGDTIADGAAVTAYILSRGIAKH